MFDNAPSRHEIAEYLPFDRQHNGHVLITSRDQSGWERVYTLDSFSETESVELLFKITPNRRKEDTDREMALEGDPHRPPVIFDNTFLAVSTLRNMSLVNPTRNNEISMHRLIQLVIQDELPAQEKQSLVLKSLSACQQILEHNDLTESLTAWQENGALVSHIQTLLTHADTLGICDTDFLSLKANLHMHMGIHFFRQDSFDLSLRFLSDAVTLGQQLSQISDVNQTKNFVTFVKATQGLSKLALHIPVTLTTNIPELLAEATRIFPTPIPSDVHYMDLYYRLSAFLITQKEYFNEAQERFKVLLSDAFQPHISPYIASKCWISLGFGHIKKSDWAGALPLFMKACEILENTTLFPQGHPNVVWVYNFIANIQTALHHDDQCKLFFQKTLDACTTFRSQSAYFGMHSHHIEALVGLATLTLAENPDLAKQQIAAAKEIQEARGIFKFADKISQLEAKVEKEGI